MRYIITVLAALIFSSVALVSGAPIAFRPSPEPPVRPNFEPPQLSHPNPVEDLVNPERTNTLRTMNPGETNPLLSNNSNVFTPQDSLYPHPGNNLIRPNPRIIPTTSASTFDLPAPTVI